MHVQKDNDDFKDWLDKKGNYEYDVILIVLC